MATPRLNRLDPEFADSDPRFANPAPSAGLEPDARVIGFWWSDVDWQWWAVTLGEVREASGNTSMSTADGMRYVETNWGLDLRLSIPRNKDRPSNSSQISGGSGREDPKTGGGRAAVAASYIPQDPATVREQIKNYIVAVTGTNNQSIIDNAVRIFSDADAAAFDNRDVETIDPWQAMKDSVRSSAAYKAVHTLRPDFVDELDWVVRRQEDLRQIGLSAQRSEEVGVELSIAGATNEALVLGGSIAHQVGTGRQLQVMRDKLKRSASAALGVV